MQILTFLLREEQFTKLEITEQQSATIQEITANLTDLLINYFN